VCIALSFQGTNRKPLPRNFEKQVEMNEKPDILTPFLFVIHQYRRTCIERATISVVAELCRRNNNITATKGKASLSAPRSGSAAIALH